MTDAPKRFTSVGDFFRRFAMIFRGGASLATTVFKIKPRLREKIFLTVAHTNSCPR